MEISDLKSIHLGLRREITIWEHHCGLLYKDGVFDRVLEPGRYSFWRWQKMSVAVVSLQQRSAIISDQAILTADKIEVRVSLVAQYAVTDPVAAVNTVENYGGQLYLDLQLTLRDTVAGYTVDALLEARSALADALLAGVAPTAAKYGITLHRVGIRDIVLPGKVRDIFMQEVEADRAGRANLIRARHEVAAARARANTAKILSENPHVVRMQEIDALIQLAGRSGSVVLLPNMADLLSGSQKSNEAESPDHRG